MKNERHTLAGRKRTSYSAWAIGYQLVLVLLAARLFAADEPPSELVDIQSVDPSIVVELRYAGAHNALHRPLYPPSTRARILPSVARQLARAQKFLHAYNYRLKIWDAYRPKSVQRELWQFARNDLYVANPESGVGSLHTWGVAVDATLVDARGRDVSMPTDFDQFTPAAMLYYERMSSNAKSHLLLLQRAMGPNGFYGLRTEWWHFSAKNWKKYVPSPEPPLTRESPKIAADAKL